MLFDLETVRFVTICLSLLQAVFLMVFAGLVRRYPGVNHAALGSTVFTFGIGLLALPDMLPGVAFFVLAPACLTLGLGILYFGMAITADKRVPLPVAAAPALVILLLHGAIYFVVPPERVTFLRIAATALVWSPLLWAVAYTLWHSPKRVLYASYRLTTALFVLLGLTFFARIVVYIVVGSVQEALGAGTEQAAMFLVLVGFSALWTMSYVLMIIQQLVGELEIAATTDFLTGVLGRRAAQAHLDYEAERAKRTGTGFSILLLDFDDFKAINDHYGHRVGDSVLRDVANILRARMRTNEILARWGGEEFLILLTTPEVAEAGRAAERLRELVAAHTIESEGHAVRCTVSIGVCTFFKSMSGIDECLAHADAALYRAKDGGRNRVVVYSGDAGGLKFSTDGQGVTVGGAA